MSRNISDLHPRLQEKLARLKELCVQNGLNIGIGECFRTVAEQDALYAQGRTKPGKKVTNAKGTSYSSQHQWRIAVDFFKNIKGHEYDDLVFFNRVGALAKSIGLGWGGDWKNPVDRPHLYLPDWGSTTTKLKKQYGTPDKFKATWESVPTTEQKGSAYMFEPKTVKEGSTGASVLLLQTILRGKGYKGQDGRSLALDGDCGRNTVYAINAYQLAMRKIGIEVGSNGKNDGICGKKMWANIIGI